jgi:hypothetical protein
VLALVLWNGLGLHAAISKGERKALIAFYNATNGDNWGKNTGWKDGALEADGFGPVGSEGKWGGITVSGDHVLIIRLVFNNLDGAIPPEIANLSHLTSIHLGRNRLSGTIPPELGNLGQLENLYLGRNQLSGTIPPELGNLRQLRNLYLSRNQLSGSIPPEWGRLSNLNYMDLSVNRLSGNIPPEWGNLGHLEYLGLSSNQLSGAIPAGLANLGQLKNLFVKGNKFSGAIPPEWGRLNNLNYMDLSANRLSGAIPDNLIDLTKTYHLRIAYNALYTNNEELRNFLNAKDFLWVESQTIAPKDISAVSTSRSSVRVSWTPILYTGGSGGYRVYCGTSPEGPWSFCGKTPNITDSSYDVTGLNSDRRYYFKIQTETQPHEHNQNKVLSEFSKVVSVITSAKKSSSVLVNL